MRIAAAAAWQLVYRTAECHRLVGDQRQPTPVEYIILPSARRPRIFVDTRAWRWVTALVEPTGRVKAAQWKILSLLGRAGLMGRAFPKVRIPPGHDTPVIGGLVNRPVQALPLLLGSEGPERKLIAQVISDDEIAGYIKITDDSTGRWLLKNEADVLRKLSGKEGLWGPSVLGYSELGDRTYLYVTPVSGRIMRGGPADPHRDFLLALRGTQCVSLDETIIHERIERASRLNARLALLWRHGRLISSGLRFWQAVVHGDFAPWNVRLMAGKLRALDWEYGTPEGIAGIDPVHFRINSMLLLERATPAVAAVELKQYVLGTRRLCGFSEWYDRDQRLAVALLAMLFDVATGLIASAQLSPINNTKLAIAESLLTI